MFEELLISGEQESTINAKIFKSREGFPPLKDMELMVAEIQNAIDLDLKDDLINIFKQHVEGYSYEKL